MSSLGERPPRSLLRLFDVLCIGIGGIVGSGIFVLPGDLARLLGALSPLAFVLAGICAVPVALCFAEMASRTRRSGGPYAYAREAFGPGVGFGVGWLVFMSFCVSWPAVAHSVPRYLEVLIPGAASPPVSTAIAVALVLATGALNYVGLRPGALAVDVLTVGKVVPLVALAVVGLLSVEPARLVPTEPPSLNNLWQSWFLAMFAVGGFEGAPVPAGETADPQKNVPRAVLGAVGSAVLLYVVLQVVAVGTVPTLAGSDKPLADAGAVVLGPWAATAVSIAGLVSMLGFVAGSALLGSRALGALADDAEVPAALARVHPRFGTPGAAIAAATALAAALAAFGGFELLVDMAVLCMLVQFIATCAAAWALRRRGGPPPGFRVPFGRATIAFALAVSAALCTQAKLRELLVASGILALGYVLRRLTRSRR